MSPERWQQIQAIFHSALELDAGSMQQYLSSICAEDPDLFMEVRSLLASDRKASGFMETPAASIGNSPWRADPSWMDLIPGEQVGPYRIVAPLGAGGMGQVYRAEDNRLGRMVAIKLLPHGLAENEQALRRFHREAQSSSVLNHPNVCTVYDVGEHHGQPFIVMELLEGRSLKELLSSDPPGMEEIPALAEAIASALEAAHAKGIIHRDIKPANTFITSRGDVKILDFGVAKLLNDPASCMRASAADSSPASVETTASAMGWTPGTVAYMSPEQALGEPVDARSDVFSLGVTLYEVATGKKPFPGETAETALESLLHSEPVKPRSLNANVPPRLEKIILKSISKNRDGRYQTAAQMRVDLQRLRTASSRPRHSLMAVAVVALACTLALLGVSLVGYRTPTQVARPSEQASGPASSVRMAVLPLQVGDGVRDAALMAEGMRHAIAGALATLAGVRVIAESSASRYAGTQKSGSTIARELNVDVVLGGSTARTGGRTILRVHLVRAGSDQPLWAESFSTSGRSVHQIRTDVTRAVSKAIGRPLSPQDEARFARNGTASHEAFENYVRARHYLAKRTAAHIERALELFKAAIDSDPAYAAAYAGLADCYNQLATVAVGQSPVENRARAIAAARKAIEIDASNAEAHAALGFARLYNWEWADAEAELTRALELNPSYASARVWHASSLLIQKRFDEAIAEVDKAGELDPLSAITQTQVGWIRAHAGRTEEAIAQFRKVLASDPDYPWALWQLGGRLSEAGKFDEAILLLNKACRFTNDNPAYLASLGGAYAKAGRTAEARRILHRLRQMSRYRYVTPIAPAEVCLALGDVDCYFRELHEGFRQRINFIAYLSVAPSPVREAAVRADSRFQELMSRLGYVIR